MSGAVPAAAAAAQVTGVTGGSHGLAAAYVAVRALAEAYDRAGDRMRGWALLGTRTLLDGDLAASALLAPRTFAEAEVAVLAAATGPQGALASAAAWEADAVAVRLAVAALEEADAGVHAAFEVLDHLAGRAVGTALPALVPGLLPALAPLAPYLPALVGRLAARHPGALQHLVNGGGGLLDGLRGPWGVPAGAPLGVPALTPGPEAAAAALATAYGDPGTGVAVPLGPPHAGRQPGGLADLLAHLDEVHTAGADGTIEVQTATGADGSVRHVVYLPGTDDLTTLPWTRDGDVRDLQTNLLLLAGADNPYQQGVLDAMAQAGVGRDEPVLLVGHSQGGMVAAAVLAQGSPFAVTAVVTAGAPTAHLDGFPAGSQVLSLEHRGDVVPLLDGEDNPDTVQQTTVRFGDQDPGPAGPADAHGIRHHTAVAAALDTAVAEGTAHPSVADVLQHLAGQGYVGGPGTTVTGQSFAVVRGP
ncbi:hypothetical protein AB0N29_08950 [Nocardioides sp. NPDC092400]|uniref:hypothetical protein n=1 Tax=Nocardioides sp. NPDC092400 TaxID=3155196 RepID=UPI003428AA81